MNNDNVIGVKKIICKKCNGEGAYHYFNQCGRCGGSGEVDPYEHDSGHNFRGQRCLECIPSPEVRKIPGYEDGLIYVGKFDCGLCHGTGCYYIETKDLKEATAVLASVE